MSITAGDYIIGGLNRIDVFDPAAITNLAAQEMRLNLNTQEALSYNDIGCPKYSIDQARQDKIWRDWIEANKPSASGAAAEELTLTNGDKIGGATAGSAGKIFIHYCGIYAISGKVLVIVSRQKLSAESGAFTVAANSIHKPTLVTDGEKFPTTLSLPAACFDNTLVTVPGAPIALTAALKFVELELDPV